MIIELGEDISRFRDASKELYKFIEAYTWNGKVERLGFDEVWMDVTDMVDFNMEIINRNYLEHSFFQTSREDPTVGFAFDATVVAGHTYPDSYGMKSVLDDLTLRLVLGSHLALYMRHQLEEKKGYTSTVGIATSKLISKLVGTLNKPKGQTTLMPPLEELPDRSSNAMRFIDGHEIGKIPGIGFKLAQKLRELVLRRPAAFDDGLVYGGTKETITVEDVRKHPEVNPELLEKLLAGPGSPHGIGFKIWCLLHAVDDSEVSQMRIVPRQISIEDSYIRLDTYPEIIKELKMLSNSLINRMRIDLTADEDDPVGEIDHDVQPLPPERISSSSIKWLAHPKTLRLTTRPRQPLQPDGTRVRSFKRISHSGPLPTFVFSLADSVDSLADTLVHGTLIGMFRRLHPEKSGWNLSLVNLAVTNMAETAGDSKTANGRDIGNMFKRQEDVLKDFRVTETDGEVEESSPVAEMVSHDKIEDGNGHDINNCDDGEEGEAAWDQDDDADDISQDACPLCGLRLPPFAMVAHSRFHDLNPS